MKYFFTIIFVLVCSFVVSAQSIDKITRRCPAPNKNVFATININNNITYTPCPDQPSFFSGKLKMLDADYIPLLGGVTNTNYFSIGTDTRFNVPTANGFIATDFNYPITINGTAKNYIGRKQAIDVQGSPVSPTIIGDYTTIFSNAFFPTGSSEVYGNLTNVDIGFPVTRGYGGYFAIQSGGSGASGAVTLTGVTGIVGMAHNGNTTNAFGGDFFLASSSSSPSLVTTAAAVRARTTINPGVTVTNLRGLALTDWVTNSGTAVNSYGIYADSSIDIGTANKFFIYSLSTSPSRLSGDVYISDNTKGIILRSPDNTCYRFTVANGGALNAGAAVTCPN